MHPSRARVSALLLALAAIAARPSSATDPQRALTLVYDGWGDEHGFVLHGRVLEDAGVSAATTDSSEAQNLVDTLKALESDEIEGARVRVQVSGAAVVATTDDDGVFTVEVNGLTGAAALPPGPTPVIATLIGPAGTSAPVARGTLFIQRSDAPFVAVVSDVDDTVVQTHVTSARKLAATVLLKNATQLEPVEGAAAAYTDAAAAGVPAFFYVSGSPQNLYPRLRAFLDEHAFPRGPLLLKNIGADKLLEQQGYKGRRLRQLLDRFPRMSVVLIGDSGEKDPEIYRALRAAYPERVAAIIIRKVPGANDDPARFAGCTVIDGRWPHPQLLTELVRAHAVQRGQQPGGGP